MDHEQKLPKVVAEYVRAFNEGDFDCLRTLFTPDAQIWGVLGSGTVEFAEPVWRELHHGMAMHLEPEAVAVDGAAVVVRYRETGVFRGHFRGISGHEPTNRPYAIIAIEWFELRGDLIAARWGARDSAAIERQVIGSA